MNMIYFELRKYELDRKKIAVIDTTLSVVKRKPEKKKKKKNRLVRDANPSTSYLFSQLLILYSRYILTRSVFRLVLRY